MSLLIFLTASCCPEESPYSLNGNDVATITKISEFEYFQIQLTELAKVSNGAAFFIVKNYDWDHVSVLGELDVIANNHALSLPASPSADYKKILKTLPAPNAETFDEQYLIHAQMELHVLIGCLEDQQKVGADIIVKALALKLLSPIVCQLNAIDSVLTK